MKLSRPVRTCWVLGAGLLLIACAAATGSPGARAAQSAAASSPAKAANGAPTTTQAAPPPKSTVAADVAVQNAATASNSAKAANGAPTNSQAPPSPTEPAEISEATAGLAKGKAAFEKACSQCHEASVAAGKRNTRAQWETTVNKMVGFGLSASDDDIEAIIAYLSATYGR